MLAAVQVRILLSFVTSILCEVKRDVRMSHICLVLKACEAGEYLSEEDRVCQKCPANTIGAQRAACVCPCVDGYFRNTESLTHPDALQYVGDSNEKPGDMCTSE